MSTPTGNSGSRSLFIGLAVALVAALAGLGAVYVTFGRPDNDRPVAGAASVPNGGPNPLSQGHMATFVFKDAPEPLPDIAFVDGTGAARTLGDFKGRVVLLNLWATWCGPCRKEMPALDRLEKVLGSERFEVVALAVDRAGADAARKFLEQTKVEALKLYVDASARSGAALKAIGMPTTLLINREGREIGRLVGPAEWDSEDAVRLIKAVVGG